MAGNGTTYQDIILFRENLNDFQALYFHSFIAHLACHAHTLENAGRIRRTTNGTGRPLTVVLTVAGFTHTAKAMTFYNALETLTFRGTHNVNSFTFGENVYSNGLAEGLSHGCIRVAEFFYVTFRGSLSFREVIFLCFGSVFFLFLTKSYLNGVVPVSELGFHLGNHVWTGFDNGNGSLFAIGLEDAGHANLFTNNTFHVLYNLAQRLRDL